MRHVTPPSSQPVRGDQENREGGETTAACLTANQGEGL